MAGTLVLAPDGHAAYDGSAMTTIAVSAASWPRRDHRRDEQVGSRARCCAGAGPDAPPRVRKTKNLSVRETFAVLSAVQSGGLRSSRGNELQPQDFMHHASRR